MPVPDARVELQIGGVQTDVTDDALHAGAIRYSWGRRGEGSRTDPAAASFALLNLDGKYSSRNPTSPYFGQLGRNTPVRLSHGGAGVALVIPAGVQARATTPDAAALDITGDIDIRVDLTPAAWGGNTYNFGWEVAGKWGAVGQQSWMMTIQDSGAPALYWSTDGTNILAFGSEAAVPFAPGQRGAIRITLDVNNGLGGYTTTYYTAPTIAGPWTQLGTPDVTTSGTTSIFNSTAALEIGDVTSMEFEDIARTYHAIEVRNGIAGTAVANPDFTAQASGATGFTDAAGRTWSAAAGLITGRRTRAVLEAASWTPKWTTASDVTTPVTAAGILRRLGQGQKALSSTLRRTLTAINGGPVAYWPLEDGSSATQAASAVAGGPPLVVSGFSFAADSSCPGAGSLPTIGSTATMEADVPTHTSPTEGYSVAMMYSLDALPASTSRILEIETSGTGRAVELVYNATDLVCNVYSATSTLLGTASFASPGYGPGTWWRVYVTAQRNGANTDFTFGVEDDSRNVISGALSVAGTPGTVSKVGTAFGSLLSGMAIGHLVVYADSEAMLYWGYAQAGFAGEEAGERIRRVCAEEGVPITIADGPGTNTLLGPQRPMQLLDLLSEIEAADGGTLCEDPDRLGFFYRTRTSLYSQSPKLTLPYSQLAPPLEPVDDDRWLRNDRTVQRTGGSSARAVLTSGPLSVAAPPDGVGTYDDSQTVNVYADSQVQGLAEWLLHRGTWDESRYPRVRLLLHKFPALIPAVATLRPGDVIRITDLPEWLPPGPIDLMVEGGDEVFKTFEWTLTLACSPAGPWTVGVLDDVTTGRADTTASTLASGITSTATSLSVATSSGPLWTTDGAEFPLDIEIGGEVMTVTAISGASSPQTVTATRSVNGIVKAHSAGAIVQLATPMILAL